MSDLPMAGSLTRMLASGLAPVQRSVAEEEAATAHACGFMVLTVPGLLQTEDYMRVVLGDVIEVYGGPCDLDEGVAARLARQRVLSEPGHTFHYVLLEQVLWSPVDGPDLWPRQLAHLEEVARGAVPSVRLGVVPRGTVWTGKVNMSLAFNLRDDREASVELPHTYLVVTDPADVAFFVRAFECAARLAVYGDEAAEIIDAARSELGMR